MPFLANDLAQPAVEQSAIRLQPDAVISIATEFASLLREVQNQDLGPENRRQLIGVLDAFEQLFVEMKATCDSIRRSPSR